jgi:hypothetical protein
MDFSKISDEELDRFLQQAQPQPQAAPQPPLDFGQMSDADLDAFLQRSAPKPQAQPEGAVPAQPIQGPPNPADQPWYAKLGGAADDMARIIANGATLGLADRFAGMASGSGYDAERAATEAARQRAGTAAIAGDVIGMAGPATVAQNLGARAVGAIAPNVAANAGLGMRTAGQAAVGAGLGGTEAAVKGEDIGRGALIGAGAGMLGNLVGEGVSAGVAKAAGLASTKPAIPSADQLTAAKGAAYDAAEKAGVVYTPDAMRALGTRLQRDFAEYGFDPALQPRAAAALNRVMQDAESNVTLKGLDTVRKVASGAYEPGNKTSNALAKKVIDGIDDLIANPQPGQVLMGDAAAGGAAIKQARDLASRLAKSDQLDYAVKKADLRAASTGSGGNADNAIRQNVRGLLEKSRGLTPDEKSAMETVVRGTPSQNALRLAGKLSPAGNGLMAALGIGATAVNPMMAIPAGVGMGAKVLADRATGKNVEKLAELIRAGGSRSAIEAPKNAVQRLTETERQTLINALMSAGISAAP